MVRIWTKVDGKSYAFQLGEQVTADQINGYSVEAVSIIKEALAAEGLLKVAKKVKRALVAIDGGYPEPKPIEDSPTA